MECEEEDGGWGSGDSGRGLPLGELLPSNLYGAWSRTLESIRQGSLSVKRQSDGN
jgi:hypothetical protein